MEIKKTLDLDTIRDSKNLATEFSDDELNEIGRKVKEGYLKDKQSRREWEKKHEDASKLALQVSESKSFPWKGASNVKFPLLTIACLQFQARAYPALVKAPDLAKYRVQGSDPDGKKAARASRISRHMSWQLLEQDEDWEEDQDKALLVIPLMGCVFKKSYFDPTCGHNRSKMVLPQNLVVNYYAASIDRCARKTEEISLQPNEIRERELRKIFKEHDYGNLPMPEATDADKRQGLTPPAADDASSRAFLEQHCLWDFDGDGYEEPYIITVEKESGKVARIVARIKSVETEQSVKIEELTTRIKALFEGLPAQEQVQQMPPEQQQQILMQIQAAEQTALGMQEEIKTLSEQKPTILRIEPFEHYTKYPFLPSPDGGFYDLGFGSLMSPLNNSVNTIMNQLIDSGTLNNGSHGFIGRGARIPGGRLRFDDPYEWKKVNVAGGTLRDNLVPLPINQPSAVLFNLLSLLISYTERVSSVTDAMQGENPGQNTPAYNMSAMLEQGMQVFNGIFKRIYRGQRSEFRKLFALNAIYLDDEEYFTYHDSEDTAVRADYRSDPKDLIPAADPNAFSGKEKLMRAQMLKEDSMMTPGYDPIVVQKRWLEAAGIPDVDEVFPLVPEMDEQGQQTGAMTYKFPPQPDPEFEIKRAEEQRRVMEAQTRADINYIEADAKLMVAEADVALKMMQAQKLGEDTNLKEFELILKELQDKRKNLVEIAKIEDARADRGMDRKSDD